tara:strand:- start:247 stop:543 length:297 start_codon:yes stop_codon:yes gene_type:complete
MMNEWPAPEWAHVKLGTKIIHVYRYKAGRLYIKEGKVTEIRKCCWTKSNKNDMVEVVFDNDPDDPSEYRKMRRRDVFKMGLIDVKKGIGYFTEEGFYG